MPTPPKTKQEDGAVRTAVSDGMVALLKEYYGVGPSQTKTYYYYDDLVVCLLRGGFTRVEQTLLEGGRTSAVTTGRRVVGFMSGNQQDPDMLCEVFVLALTDFLNGDQLERTAARWAADPPG